MKSHTNRAFALVRWIDSRGTLLALLVLLIAVGMMAHYGAMSRIRINDAAVMPTATAAARLKCIGYVDEHPWITVPYLMTYAASLAWMQFRAAPPWSLRLAFALMALPVFGYMWICLRVSTSALISR